MADAANRQKPVVRGVLGASHFALAAAIPAMRGAPLATLGALSSRSLDKARQAAARAGAPRAYGSYEELVADPEIPFNAPHDRPCRVFVNGGVAEAPDFTGAKSSDERRELLPLERANHYTLQWQAFSEAIRNGTSVENDIESAVANARVTEAVFRSADSQRWEAV